MITVRDIMTTDVVTLPEDSPLRKLGEVLEARGAVGAVVVRDGLVVGVVPAAFFVNAAAERAGEAATSGDAARTVGEVMAPALCTVSPDATLDEAASRMERAGVRRLLVEEGARLVGVLTLSDMAKAAAAGPRAEAG